MKKRGNRISILVGLGLGVMLLAGCGGQKTTTTNTTQAKTVLPVASNPIEIGGKQEGLKITAAMVEDNVDPATKKALTDRLQVTLKNTAAAPISELEIYYTMTDATTKKAEGYYEKLTGITLAPGKTATVYFDNKTGAGHYPENKYSIYRSSKNEVDFSIMVSSPGFIPATAEAKKSVGTGEAVD
jgi:hypothetical protein